VVLHQMRKRGQRLVRVARLAVPEMQGTLLRGLPEAHGRKMVQETRVPRVPNRARGGLTRASRRKLQSVLKGGSRSLVTLAESNLVASSSLWDQTAKSAAGQLVTPPVAKSSATETREVSASGLQGA